MQCANGEPLENLVQEDNITGFVFRTKKTWQDQRGKEAEGENGSRKPVGSYLNDLNKQGV